MKKYFQVTQAGASQDELDELGRQLGHELPDAYLSLLRQTNGAELGVHDVGGDCLQLWKVHEVPKLNRDYQVRRYLPEVVAIASNGGGKAIILDRIVSIDPNQWPLFLVDFGALDRDEFTPVAANFQDWVQREFRLPGCR